jgi:hypothetical protein
MLNVPVSFDKRPPFVRFEEREYGLNAEASTAAGRPVPKVELMACITSAGSKDVHERPAKEWIDQKRALAAKGEYPLDWVDMFERQYEQYLKGNELPRDGTPIKTWQMLTKDQINRCLACNIATVEDLEMVPDSGLSMMGLDARAMRDMARAWLKEGKEKGSVAKELADANARIVALEERLDAIAKMKSGKAA